MQFIEETGFRVRPNRQEEFQRWLADNEERIARTYPDGTEYLGTFAVVFASGKTASEYRTLERLDSYAALDKLAALGKDPTTEYARVMREFVAFLDPDPNAPWSESLFKRAVDATIWDVPSAP